MDKESRQLVALINYSSQAVKDQASERIECISDNVQLDFTAIVNEETDPGSECVQLEQPSGNSISGRSDSNTTIRWNATTTILDNGSSETSGEVTRWLELYDPGYEVMYYFSQQFGEFRWGPLEASALIRRCNSSSVLSAIVSLQCAARCQQARKKILMMQQKLEMYSSDQSITTENSHRDEDNDTTYTTASLEVPLHQWDEVYDPITQMQYFHNPCTGETRWDLPGNCVSSIDERQVAAAISIQSLSRGYIARTKVRDYRERSLLQGVNHTSQEGETPCRGMKDPQHQVGDFLEKFDDCKHEVFQTHTINDANNVAHSIPNYLDIEEEQVVCEHLAQEQEKNEDACMSMHHEEKLQCQRGDNFWGIQAEEARQNAANIAMALEEKASRHFEDTVLEQALKAAWEDEKSQLLCTGEPRWDLSGNCVSSIDERKVAAAISIQSLSRGYIARTKVRENRERSLLQGVNHTSQEGETSCRGMKDPQHQDGDVLEKFDDCKHEVLQTHTINDATIVAHSIPNYLDIEEEQVVCERLAQEQEKNEDACMLMHHEEKLQCQRGDSFWGIQAEEARQNAANIAMALEEKASRHFEDFVLEQALKAAWEVKKLQLSSNEQAAHNGLRQRMQARYLSWFYHQCVSVDGLLDYRWPTHQHQERPNGASSPGKQQRIPVCAESATLALPHSGEFVSHNHSRSEDLHCRLRTSLTVHHQSICKPNGTHFVVTKASRECAFDEATAAKLIKARNINKGVVNKCKPHIGEECRMKTTKRGSNVNNDQYRTPNLHLPARFNGVPYKPNQISPTRDILNVNHRKLNQLPSLVKTMKRPKMCQPQEVKIRAKSTFSALSNPAPSSLESEGGVDLKMDRDDASLHAQFERQDHAILFKIFSLIDLDQSGIVNLDEMRWALQHDAEIQTFAKTSPLLRILLKQGNLEDLFSTRAVDPSKNSKELSWDAFLAGGERSYLRLVSNGLIESHVGTRLETRSGADKIASDVSNEERENLLAREMEISSIRRVFALLDSGNEGLLNVADIQRNLYDLMAIMPETCKKTSTYDELRALVKASNTLHLMFHEEIFRKAFTTYEPMDPGGINEEEFVTFYLEIAQIAITNHMVAPTN